MSAIQLGDKIRDRVSGIEGIAIARTEWMFGCVRWLLQPQSADKEGKPHEGFTVDEPQLVVVKAGVVKRELPVPPAPRKHGNRPDLPTIRRSETPHR